MTFLNHVKKFEPICVLLYYIVVFFINLHFLFPNNWYLYASSEFSFFVTSLVLSYKTEYLFPKQTYFFH